MEGSNPTPENPNKNDKPGAVPDFSRATLELTGKNAHLETLRTFQSDLASTIKSGEGSLVKIAMAEHEKKERQKENVDPASKKNITLVLASIALIVLAVVIVGYVIYLKLPQIVPVTRDQSTLPTIITTDSMQGLNITNLSRDNVRDMIGKEYATGTPTLNTIEQVFLFTQQDKNQNILTTSDFFKSIESSIPDQLVRSLDPVFTIGIHAYNGNGLFLAFHTNSYTTAFAGMLSWEKDLFDEMYRIFKIPVAGENSKLFSAQFKDRVIKNQDSRAIVDENGKPVLFYTFLGEDKSIIIIADKETTITEILNRLTAHTIRK